MADLVSISYGVCLTVVVLFGIGALILAKLRNKRHAQTQEFFLTARKSVNEFTIAWSFYATGVGAW